MKTNDTDSECVCNLLSAVVCQPNSEWNFHSCKHISPSALQVNSSISFRNLLHVIYGNGTPAVSLLDISVVHLHSFSSCSANALALNWISIEAVLCWGLMETNHSPLMFLSFLLRSVWGKKIGIGRWLNRQDCSVVVRKQVFWVKMIILLRLDKHWLTAHIWAQEEII